MMGTFQNCRVLKRASEGLWLLNEDGIEVLLDTEEIPVGIKPDQFLECFCWWDQKENPRATRHKPINHVGEFEKLVVKAVTPVGAWLDWGMDEYLFLPLHYQKGPVAVDERVVVRIICEGSRILATQKLEGFFSEDTSQCRPADPVFLIVYQVDGEMAQCVVDGIWTGELAVDETRKGIRLAQTFNGYIKEVTEDGRLLLTLKMVAYHAVMEEAQVVVDKLVEAGGYLPLNDRSDPKEIRRVFSLSKKEYKKLLTGLVRQELIDITDDGITLIQ